MTESISTTDSGSDKMDPRCPDKVVRYSDKGWLCKYFFGQDFHVSKGFGIVMKVGFVETIPKIPPRVKILLRFFYLIGTRKLEVIRPIN